MPIHICDKCTLFLSIVCKLFVQKLLFIFLIWTTLINSPCAYCTLGFWLIFLHYKVFNTYLYVSFDCGKLCTVNLIRHILTKWRNIINLQSGHLYIYYIYKSIYLVNLNNSGVINHIICVPDILLCLLCLLMQRLIIIYLIWLAPKANLMLQIYKHIKA